MGNLYTQLQRIPDKRLQILSDLKYLWKQYRVEKGKLKRDVHEKIKEKQKELEVLEQSKKKVPLSLKQQHGAFAWKFRKRRVVK